MRKSGVFCIFYFQGIRKAFLKNFILFILGLRFKEKILRYIGVGTKIRFADSHMEH